MPDDLSVAVERLRTSTQRLNTICDSAAQVIRDIEAFLQEHHVGVAASVEVSRDDVTGEGRYFDITYLAYTRCKGTFRISVVVDPVSAQGPEDLYTTPWAECSRDTKIETLDKLPELIVELANQVDSRSARAEKALASVSGLLKTTPKKKGGA
jgi:hypothetical protein